MGIYNNRKQSKVVIVHFVHENLSVINQILPVRRVKKHPGCLAFACFCNKVNIGGC